MKIIKNPDKKEWPKLTKRPTIKQDDLFNIVNQVFLDIKKYGDKALKKYALLFDKVSLEKFEVSKDQIEKAKDHISKELQNAINVAKNNIEKFHASQIEEKKVIETIDGVKCWRESRPIEKVGIYIPGGSAPLFSTVLMLGIPAKLAQCKEIILCSPPNKNGEIHPTILYTANLVGIDKIFAIGGIQAIGAMTFGTESVPKVYKLFGPGNQYVTAAKQMALNYGVAIDLPAGPSEVLVIADKYSNVEFVAADLLSQAEHGTDSQVILLSDNQKVLEEVITEINKQLKKLPRKDIAKQSLRNSKFILFKNIEECIDFSNEYAPEHLIISVKDYNKYIDKIINAGSVFLGNYSCESAGDYASGTNHTLPTNGFARNYSGVSLDSFIKKITFQELNEKGIKNIGSTVELMAEAENLIGHKNAVSIRMKNLKNV
jgi:histidinol dehydrogenase